MPKWKLTGPVWLMQPIPYFGEKLCGSWVYEPKIDGWRLQIINYREGRIECWGRRLERHPDWTPKLPWLVKEAAENIPPGCLIDAELYTSKGRRFIPSLFSRKRKARPIVYVFDIVFYKNEFIGEYSLEERRKVLQELNLKSPFQLVKYELLQDLKQALWKAVKKGYEGIVIKKLDSKYLLSADGPVATEDWRKIKPS